MNSIKIDEYLRWNAKKTERSGFERGLRVLKWRSIGDNQGHNTLFINRFASVQQNLNICKK